MESNSSSVQNQLNFPASGRKNLRTFPPRKQQSNDRETSGSSIRASSGKQIKKQKQYFVNIKVAAVQKMEAAIYSTWKQSKGVIRLKSREASRESSNLSTKNKKNFQPDIFNMRAAAAAATNGSRVKSGSSANSCAATTPDPTTTASPYGIAQTSHLSKLFPRCSSAKSHVYISKHCTYLLQDLCRVCGLEILSLKHPFKNILWKPVIGPMLQLYQVC